MNADGTERREYRPPSEAFDEQSLDSILGKPITLGHPGMVNADNAKNMPIVGAAVSKGYRDGNAIRADVSLFQLPTTARELSCGYTLELDETPGVTPEGERYDAVQRNVRVNHIAIVPKGRAGIARLNMDGEQEFDEPRKDDENMADKMTKIRLDGGLEYEAAPEVGVYVEKLRAENEKIRSDATEAAKKAADEKDQLQAKYDAAISDAEKVKKEREDAEKAAKENFDAAVKARVELLTTAAKHKVEKADEMTDNEIRVAVIKAVRGDSFNLDGKSDAYIEAAFDMAKDDAKTREDNMASQRAAATSVPKDTGDAKREDSAEAAYQKLIEAEAQMYLKGRE